MKKSIFAVLVTGLFLLGMAGSASAELLTFDTMPDGGGAVVLGTDMEWEDGYLYTDINTEPSADLFFNDTVYLNEFQMGGGDGIATVTAYSRIGTSFDYNELWTIDVDLSGAWVDVTAGLAGVDKLSVVPNDFVAKLDNMRINEVPNPVSIILFGAGLTGLTGLLRRKER